MARLVAVVLLLTLGLVPAVSAEPQARESPSAGWLDVFRGALDWIFSWIPTIRSEPRKAGAILVPTGVTQPSPSRAGAIIVPTGLQSAPREAGAILVPTGISANPGLPEHLKLRGSAAIQQN